MQFQPDPDAYGVRRMTRSLSQSSSIGSESTATTATGVGAAAAAVEGAARDAEGRYPQVRTRSRVLDLKPSISNSC